MRNFLQAIILTITFFYFPSSTCSAELPYSWYAQDRAVKVAELIPGKKIPMPPPEEFLAEWTRKQVEKWEEGHKPLSSEEAFGIYSIAEPSDEELTAYFPDHISPFGYVLHGDPGSQKAGDVMIKYCPFCGVQGSFGLKVVGPFHGITTCCGQDLYNRDHGFVVN